MWKLQVPQNEKKQSKFHARRNSEHIKFGECLLSAESCFLRFLFKNIKQKTYKAIILPVVLYGFETLSFSLSEDGLRRLENQSADRVTWLLEEASNRRMSQIGLRDLCFLPNTINMIESSRLRWAMHVACVREKRNAGFWWEFGKEGGHLGNLGLNWRIVLQQMLNK